MRALQYWKAVTMDRSDFLERLLAVFESLGVEFCVVGDAAVNAYCEAHIVRLMEADPEWRKRVPADVLAMLIQ